MMKVPTPVVMAALEERAADRLAHDLGALDIPLRFASVQDYEQLQRGGAESVPAIVIVDEPVLASGHSAMSAEDLAALAPLVFIASPLAIDKLAGLVAEGRVDPVVRAGNYLPLASAFAKRRLRQWRQQIIPMPPPDPEYVVEVLENIRHEINNPLTGILGNAELLLAAGDHLNPTSLQRLQTIVDMAVRLRETVRRLTDAAESAKSHARSA